MQQAYHSAKTISKDVATHASSAVIKPSTRPTSAAVATPPTYSNATPSQVPSTGYNADHKTDPSRSVIADIQPPNKWADPPKKATAYVSPYAPPAWTTTVNTLPTPTRPAKSLGFSGEDTPRGTFQTTYGQPRNPDWLVSHNAGVKPDREYFVGKECHAIREHLDMVDPIQRGVITDWDAMEKVWDYTFEHEMRMNPEAISMPVLCTSSSPTPKAQLEKTAQIMFESFKTTAFYSMQQCVLSLFASGRTRGLVLEAGHGSSHAVPIFE
ncbi:hypothetical protein DYB26_011769, partial [Aphanomyces astaci]